MDKLITEIKKFCRENYENGYDAVVECWGLADYQEWIENYNTKSLSDFVEQYAVVISYANEIRSTAF